MSTRCNIVIKDDYGSELWFYRHSDGYPECAGESLKEFCQGYASGKLRNNVEQSSGWLILHRHEEYKKYGYDWKVGAYEPSVGQHGDIEFLYTIDLGGKFLEVKDVYSGGKTELMTW